MRNSIRITLLFIALLTVQGCTNSIFDPEPNTVQGENPATLKIGIVTRAAATRATGLHDGVLGEAEYAVKSLRIYAFESDGTFDTMDFVTYRLPIVGSVTHNIEVKKAAQKKLYVVVNEPAELTTQLDGITSVADLKNISFTLANAMNGGFAADASFASSDFVIPMTAVTTIDASGDKDVKIGVNRAVARVDLMLDKNAEASSKQVLVNASTVFKVNGVVVHSHLMAGATLPTLTKADVEPPFASIASEVELQPEKSDNTTAQRVLSFYVAERNYDCDDTDTRISIQVDRLFVDGTEVTIDNTVVLGKEQSTPLNELKRNHIYRIFATYVGVVEELVPDQFTIVEWTEEVLDGEIEGVMMAVDNTLVMDWLRNGNSFTAPISSFGSSKPIEVYLPVTTGEVDAEGNKAYRFEKYTFPTVSAGARYDLRALPLENNYILETKWISDAHLVFTSDRTGYLSVTYTPAWTPYALQNYPIRFKSDNVVKQMKVIYDNGYIPQEFLPPHWAARAPGGVVFAKRGYKQSPTEVADVYERDADGYYRGEHALTVAEGDAYCKELGEMWYLPSYEDMQAMIPGVKELGTSYRFQDTGSATGGTATPALYWTNTESTATPGHYWCGNFIHNPDRVTNVFDWLEERSGTEKHYIRCALDIK